MKLLCLLPVFAALLPNTNAENLRALAGASGFKFVYSTVEGVHWCITANNDIHTGAQVQVVPCDFAGAPNTQLWKYEGNLFKSKKDQGQCLKAEYGGGRVRMAACDPYDDWQKFLHDSGDKIRVQGDAAYCVTSQGSDPWAGNGNAVAVRCGGSSRFRFKRSSTGEIVDDPEPEGPEPPDGLTPGRQFGLESRDSDGLACLVVRDDDAKLRQFLILDNCKGINEWVYDSDTGLMKTTLNENLCMTAGSRDVNWDYPLHGWQMRLDTCDPSNDKQVFDWDGSRLRLSDYSSFCVGFQGTVDPDIGNTNIILKQPCSARGNRWRED